MEGNKNALRLLGELKYVKVSKELPEDFLLWLRDKGNLGSEHEKRPSVVFAENSRVC